MEISIGTLLVIAVVLAALLAAAAALIRASSPQARRQNVTTAYEAAPPLLTAAERSFFGVLQQAVASDYHVFAKVRLADIVRPVSNHSRSGWQSAFNPITGKHVDFVLCEKSRLTVVAVVELDDRSHESFARGFRDELVDSALADARIPILRVSVRQAYSLGVIREQVKKTMSASQQCRPNLQ